MTQLPHEIEKLFGINGRNTQGYLLQYIQQDLYRFERREDRHVVLDGRAANLVTIQPVLCWLMSIVLMM